MRNLNIEVNTNKQILSSETKIYKTESFFYQTKKIAKIDTFILNIAEGLLSVLDEMFVEFQGNEKINGFQIDTFDRSFSFYIKLGFQLKNVDFAEKDIIFYKTSGDFNEMELDEYILVTAKQLSILREDIIIHRINGDAPREQLIAPLWSLKKLVVMNELDKYMKDHDLYQGKEYKKA